MNKDFLMEVNYMVLQIFANSLKIQEVCLVQKLLSLVVLILYYKKNF